MAARDINMAASRTVGSTTSENPPAAPRFKDELTFGISELSPAISIVDTEGEVVELFWGEIDGEPIILNMHVIQIGYTYIDAAGKRYKIKGVDRNAHKITIELPAFDASVNPPAEPAEAAEPAASLRTQAEAEAEATLSAASSSKKGGMKKRRAHKRHTKKRHTKKRRTHKYRARK